MCNQSPNYNLLIIHGDNQASRPQSQHIIRPHLSPLPKNPVGFLNQILSNILPETNMAPKKW